jgi:hypothetical protein
MFAREAARTFCLPFVRRGDVCVLVSISLLLIRGLPLDLELIGVHAVKGGYLKE